MYYLSLKIRFLYTQKTKTFICNTITENNTCINLLTLKILVRSYVRNIDELVKLKIRK